MEGLIYSIANRYRGFLRRHPAYDLEDLIQEGRLAVLAAEKTYSPEKGAFSTWACYHIRTAINRALGIRWEKGKGTVAPPLLASLDAPMEEDEKLTLLDMIADPGACEGWEGMATSQVQQEVKEAVEQLPGVLYDIAKRHILNREPLASVAADCGLSPMQAIYKKEATLKALRKQLMPLYREYVLDMETNWYKRKSVAAILGDNSSTVEDIALWRIERG